jgi:hypothetical protein
MGLPHMAREVRDISRGPQEAKIQAMALDCRGGGGGGGEKRYKWLGYQALLNWTRWGKFFSFNCKEKHRTISQFATRTRRSHLQPEVQQRRHVLEASRASAIQEVAAEVEVLHWTAGRENG